MLETILANTAFAVIAYAVAQIADVVTTNAAIRSGRGREANRFIAWVMGRTGHLWAAVKLALALGAAVAILYCAGPIWLWPLTAITGYVAWHNSRVI